MQDSDFNDEISPWWRLADKLNVVQATLLVLGIEPQSLADYIENQASAHHPKGYAAVKAGIIGGLLISAEN